MKYTVEVIENAKTKEDWQKVNINRTLVQAYLWSMEAGNDLPNFAEVIWDEDIEAILQDCKENGIKEFTISSTFSSLITTIDKLTELGCSLDGIIKINDRYTHFGREERDLIPAFKMTVKEA